MHFLKKNDFFICLSHSNRGGLWDLGFGVTNTVFQAPDYCLLKWDSFLLPNSKITPYLITDYFLY
jgi:hypothetical protein